MRVDSQPGDQSLSSSDPVRKDRDGLGTSSQWRRAVDRGARKGALVLPAAMLGTMECDPVRQGTPARFSLQIDNVASRWGGCFTARRGSSV